MGNIHQVQIIIRVTEEFGNSLGERTMLPSGVGECYELIEKAFRTSLLVSIISTAPRRGGAILRRGD